MNETVFSPTDSVDSRSLILARWVAVITTTGIGVSGFVLSFAALWDLASRAGLPAKLAWLWPVIVDGTIVQATVSIAALAADPTAVRSRRFFWVVLAGAAALSISGNALHAWVNGADDLYPIVAAVIAAVAPISLLATTHGLAILARPGPRIAAETDALTVPMTSSRSVQMVLAESARLWSTSESVTEPCGGATLSELTWPTKAAVPPGEPEQWRMIAEQVCAGDPTGQRDPVVVARVLWLKHEHGWTHRRIGKDTGIHHSTVGRIVHTAATLRGHVEAVVP